jgi:hypothetical protein
VIAAAFHEAGHAFGYARQHDAELRSVTVNRDGTGITYGGCRGVNLAEITALGPIAQAVWEENTGDPSDGCDFDTCLVAAIYSGTCAPDYYGDARIVLDDRAWTDVLRRDVVEHWAGLTRLALTLTLRGTVNGAEAERLLR